jgi:small subunit ribosomal protein S2
MIRLEKMRDNNELEHLTKKEGLLIGREIIRLQTRLEGLRTMKKRPDLIFIIDVGREDSAVKDANLLSIPIVALVDTNCNPQNIDYVIPSNDDAIRAIKLLVGKVADAVLEGKALRKEDDDESADAMPSAAGDRKPVRIVEDDDDIDDEELLGEATLAKLSASQEEETAESDSEETKETDSEETDVADAEETASEETASAETEETEETESKE